MEAYDLGSEISDWDSFAALIRNSYWMQTWYEDNQGSHENIVKTKKWNGNKAGIMRQALENAGDLFGALLCFHHFTYIFQKVDYVKGYIERGDFTKDNFETYWDGIISENKKNETYKNNLLEIWNNIIPLNTVTRWSKNIILALLNGDFDALKENVSNFLDNEEEIRNELDMISTLFIKSGWPFNFCDGGRFNSKKSKPSQRACRDKEDYMEIEGEYEGADEGEEQRREKRPRDDKIVILSDDDEGYGDDGSAEEPEPPKKIWKGEEEEREREREEEVDKIVKSVMSRPLIRPTQPTQLEPSITKVQPWDLNPDDLFSSSEEG